MGNNNKVMMAMSGGVDSSVGAFLLKEQGYNVTGVTMCLGVKGVGESNASCCGPEAILDAKNVCSALRIPHYVFDFSNELESMVINKFVSDYQNGVTPNPCVECNRSLKFDSLLKRALVMGFDFIATGHYADISEDNRFLKIPKDKNKDQTYFLYPIKPENLKNILFPLSGYTKQEARAVAKENKIPVADKKESQDICFIPDGDMESFIKKRGVENKPGNIVDKQGKILGSHKGICFYTVGQRKGLGISSKKPLYVVSINAEQNEIVCGDKDSLYSKELTAVNANIFSEDIFKTVSYAKIRYNHMPVKCSVTLFGDKLRVILEEPQKAVTPGQSIVFYKDGFVLAGGIINRVLN